MTDDLSIETDMTAGLIRVTGKGFWSPEQISAHCDLLDESLGRVRARHSRVKALIDLRQAVTQSADTTRVIHEAAGRLYRTDDRIAIVTLSVLTAMQMQRTIDRSPMKTFGTVADAETWLDLAVPD